MNVKSRIEKLEQARPPDIPDTPEGRRHWLRSLTDAQLCDLMGVSEDVTDGELAAMIEDGDKWQQMA